MLHSILSPSSAGIWGPPDGCTGYVLMSQTYPETEENEDSRIGNAAHEMGAELIDYSARGVNSTTAEEYIGETASNGVIYTEEMFDGAKLYADDVATVMRETSIFGGEYFGTETRIEAKSIHELSYGTTDQFIFNHRERHLYIWDFKFGFGFVDAFENWQLINYVQGIAERFNIDGIEAQNLTVHIRVVQPRAFHSSGPIKEWIIKLSDLRGYVNILHANAHIALGNDSIIRSGPHCKDCEARHACPAALRSGMSLYEVSMKTTPMELSPEALGVQLAIVKRAVKQLKAIESGLDEQVKATIRRGGLVPNFMVEMGYGKLSWSKSISEVIEMGNKHLLTLQKPIEVITPTQALALAKKAGVGTDDIKKSSTKPQAGLTIVPDDGKKARKIFSNQ